MEMVLYGGIKFIFKRYIMTVRELKEKLNTMPDNYIVLVNVERAGYPYTEATCVIKGFNELDGCVIIDDYVEEEDEE